MELLGRAEDEQNMVGRKEVELLQDSDYIRSRSAWISGFDSLQLGYIMELCPSQNAPLKYYNFLRKKQLPAIKSKPNDQTAPKKKP